MKDFNYIENELKQRDVVSYTTLKLVGKLMAYRGQQGISQRKLSEMTGIAQKTISRIESGKDFPKLETLIKMADALGYTLELKKKEN
jgi:transcriptional regulator with XRE-family HTH domain